MDADCIGDGGGSGSSAGELRSSFEVAADTGLPGPGESARLVLDRADFPLLPDRTDAASDLSTTASPLLRFEEEFRGLSVLLPGIFDLRPLSDLIDSFVSVLLKDG